MCLQKKKEKTSTFYKKPQIIRNYRIIKTVLIKINPCKQRLTGNFIKLKLSVKYLILCLSAQNSGMSVVPVGCRARRTGAVGPQVLQFPGFILSVQVTNAGLMGQGQGDALVFRLKHNRRAGGKGGVRLAASRSSQRATLTGFVRHNL